MASGEKDPNLAMGDLLEYFEDQGHRLDMESAIQDIIPTSNFVSRIKFNGVPILPPVLSEQKRQEMLSLQRQASKKERTIKARKREQLHAKVQSIVAGVEERRAAHAASKASTLSKANKGKQSGSTGATTKHLSPADGALNHVTSAYKGAHVEHSVGDGDSQSKTSRKNVGGKIPEIQVHPTGGMPSQSAAVPKLKLQLDVEEMTTGMKNSESSTSTSASSMSTVRSTGKSFSQVSNDMMKKQLPDSKKPEKLSLSPPDKLRVPRPPSEERVGKSGLRRSSNMRQSISLQDLRSIDFTVEKEELKKPLPSRPMSSKDKTGSSPHAQKSAKSVVEKQKKTKAVQEKDKSQDSKDRKKETSQDRYKADGSSKQQGTKIKKETGDSSLRKAESGKQQPKTAKSDPPAKSTPPVKSSPLQTNPSNVASVAGDGSSCVRTEEGEVLQRPETGPVTSAADLFPFPITEEQALATLDSLQSDFASLEECTSLPHDYNGMPLTSVKEQRIMHMLSKLSKALNIEDTLTSTTSSNTSADTGTDTMGTVVHVMGDNQTSKEGASKQLSSPSGAQSVPVLNAAKGKPMQALRVDTTDTGDEMSPNVTSDSHLTSASPVSSAQTSNLSSSSSVHSRGRMSPTASILSSASSVGASRSRMSPKSLKNTVHFSSFVTEISTSASQSVEDKISVRKLEVTPVNSPRVECKEPPGVAEAVKNDSTKMMSSSSNTGSKNLNSTGSVGPSALQRSDSLLSKVALSPEVDSPGDTETQDRFPFGNYSNDGELNTSDKENQEFQPQELDPRSSHSSSRESQGSSQRRSGGNVGDSVKSSVKSDVSEHSTLKGSQDRLLSQGTSVKMNITSDTVQYPYGTASTSLGKYMRGSQATNSSSTSMPEEISKSYMMSQGFQDSGNQEMNISVERDEHSQQELNVPVNNDSKDENVANSKNCNVKKHARRGSYTLDEPSPVLQRPVVHSQPNRQEDGIHNVRTGKEKIAHNSKSVSRKLNLKDKEGKCSDKAVDEIVVAEPNTTEQVEEEQEGKAEHIQRYLLQVHEQSLQNEAEFQKGLESVTGPEEVVQMNNLGKGSSNLNVVDDIGATIMSFTESLNSMNHLSQEEMFQLQAQQFDALRSHLIQQQQQQLEELFVHQRREQMKLQMELEQYQKQLSEQDQLANQDFLLQQELPTQQQRPVSQQTSAPQQMFVTQPMSASQPVSMPQKMVSQKKQTCAIPQQVPVQPQISHLQPQVAQAWQAQTRVPMVTDPNLSQLSNPYSYISSPSLYMNPKDRDNVSEISSFAKGSPKQLLFSNQSTPVSKVYKPVLRSPVKQPRLPYRRDRVTVPDRANDRDMLPKFERLTAVAKGFLTRKLLKTQKVQELLKTIHDTREFAFSFQAETPMRTGTLTQQDMNLLERIVAQLQAALLDIHEIFFVIPVSERMGLIAHTHQLEEEKRVRESQRSSMSTSESSQRRISAATLKAMERKRKALEAEEAVFGQGQGHLRPKSAPPPTTSSPRNRSTDIRALRPIQGQISPIRPDEQISVRESKPRPKSAPEKPAMKRKTSKSNKTTSGKPRVKSKPKPKTEKAWR